MTLPAEGGGAGDGSPPEIPASPSRVSPPSLCESIQQVLWSWEVLQWLVYGRSVEMGVQL